MPCWEVRQTSVKLEVSDWALLGRALRAEFGEKNIVEQSTQYRVYSSSGWITVVKDAILDASEAEANRVKVAYSREVIRDTAKRFNWRLQDAGVNRFTAQKRG